MNHWLRKSSLKQIYRCPLQMPLELACSLCQPLDLKSDPVWDALTSRLWVTRLIYFMTYLHK